MRLLLDSHVAVWWVAGLGELGPQCRGALSEADVAAVSVVSYWELAIKRAAGRLTYPDGLRAALEGSGIATLPISVEHAEAAAALPLHHRDPFDRMLVAQAQMESLVLVTADDALGRYDVDVLAARR